MIILKDYNNTNDNYKCIHCNSRCPKGELRGKPCETQEELDMSKSKDLHIRTKKESGADNIRMNGNIHKEQKHPKSGPRTYTRGQQERYSNSPIFCKGCGYGHAHCRCCNGCGESKRWCNCDDVVEEPICPVCNNESEPGTCPACN